jgi:hydroxyacylglutathione hydrolase
MKRIYKRILTGIAAVVLLILLLSIGYFFKARGIIKEMTPAETMEIVENVFSVKDSFLNFYLIKTGEHYIALDAGNKPGNIQHELKKLAIEPEKIIAVFLTHTDGDHVAGISLFKNASIYLSTQEEQMINGKKSRFFLFGNKIDSQKYKLIDDQQITTLGNLNIKGFITPGHTPGSMCYLVNDSLLFTGDAFKLKKGKIEDFDSFFNMNSKIANKSIATIVKLPGVKYIFTAHYGYSNNFKNSVKDWPL